jgi:hypothetical protein
VAYIVVLAVNIKKENVQAAQKMKRLHGAKLDPVALKRELNLVPIAKNFRMLRIAKSSIIL